MFVVQNLKAGLYIIFTIQGVFSETNQPTMFATRRRALVRAVSGHALFTTQTPLSHFPSNPCFSRAQNDSDPDKDAPWRLRTHINGQVFKTGSVGDTTDVARCVKGIVLGNVVAVFLALGGWTGMLLYSLDDVPRRLRPLMLHIDSVWDGFMFTSSLVLVRINTRSCSPGARLHAMLFTAAFHVGSSGAFRDFLRS
jgi:hypothetical protein